MERNVGRLAAILEGKTVRQIIAAIPGIKVWTSEEGPAAQSAGSCDENTRE